MPIENSTPSPEKNSKLLAPPTLAASEAPLLIPADEVARLVGISERTLWRLLSLGKLPQPLRLGRNTRWRLAELTAWIDRGCPPIGKADRA